MGTNHIVSCLSIQDPFPIGLDELDREVFSVNFMLNIHYPYYNIEQMILNLLTSSPSLVTINSDVFVGFKPVIPSTPGPFTTLIMTGGTPPEEAHTGERWDYPTFQLLVRAGDYTAARDKILAEWSRLHGIRNRDVSYDAPE